MKTTLIINNISSLDKSIAPNSTLPLHKSSNYTHKRILAHERLSNICTSVLVLLSILCGIYLLRDLIFWRQGITANSEQNERTSLDLRRVREIVLASDADSSRVRNVQCRYWNCLSLYRCGQDHLKVYVYPLEEYEDESTGKLASTLTAEYYTILKTVVRSDYYTANPNESCLFLPSLDLLNEQLVVPEMASRALAQLPHWDEGKNHLIFNFLTRGPAHTLETATDSAIIIGGSFDIWTYRRGFDISLPIWSPHLASFDSSQIQHVKRKYTLIAAQLHVSATNLRTMQMIAQKHVQQVLLLQDCINAGRSDSSSSSSVDNAKQQQQYEEQTTNKRNMRCSRNGGRHGGAYEYPSVLAKGTFCLMTRTTHNSGQADLLEILAHNCIPVVAINNYVLPFEDVIDWTLAAIRLNESDLHAILQRVNEVSSLRISEFQQQIRWLYENYFRNLSTITLTALDILQDRIFPHRARSLRQWNTHATQSVYRAAQNPLFLPLVSSRAQGFTAVILTYDRVESLFTLIHKLAAVPSLQSILVIWNNQRKSPPHLSAFPAIMKPLKVIQTRANKLSNRFYPYAEIETEAILTIDDDINMLTADELDFGFEVWREFPDRIVGFPSRQHVWDNVTQQWRYESEWTNEISMVLTGAAFHHKIWSHMYTYNMPFAIKQWVDEHMNCEDIAMNFLVANITNQPPIKVTPRKKFKCPQCTNTEMLSADLNHMRERSACIHRFAQQYGRMPLRSVEFRADPVLFRDNFPEKLKRFNDIGTL